MATAQSVLDKSIEAVNEAYALAGVPNPTAALQAQVAALQAKLDSALVLVNDAIAADTQADQAEAQRLAAAAAALQ